MGQKVHPYGFRLGSLYGWQSNWFAERRYAEQLHEDLALRAFIKKKLFLVILFLVFCVFTTPLLEVEQLVLEYFIDTY